MIVLAAACLPTTAFAQDGGRLNAVALESRTNGAAGQLAAAYWRQADSSIARVRDDRVLWRFHYGGELDKPYFHPLAMPDGCVLTWNAPADHAWHHGLWFSWKFINGVNYWESSSGSGRADGATTCSGVHVDAHPDGSATIAMAVSYGPRGDQPALLQERRTMQVSAPDAAGDYHIDWISAFTAAEDVTLDRSPPQPGAAGGYAGLSVRLAENLAERVATNVEGPVAFDSGDRHRGASVAMDYSGVVEGKSGGIAILDHPRNPRSPTPWYVIRLPVISYMNAAVLNDAPLRLAAGEQLTLRYRICIHSGRWQAEQLREAYAAFAGDATATQPSTAAGEK